MKCYACGEELLNPILQLGFVPLVDKYLIEITHFLYANVEL